MKQLLRRRLVSGPDAQRIRGLHPAGSGIKTALDRIFGHSRLLVILNVIVGVLLLFAILFF